MFLEVLGYAFIWTKKHGYLFQQHLTHCKAMRTMLVTTVN